MGQGKHLQNTTRYIMIESEQRKPVVWVNIPISRSVTSMVTNATTQQQHYHGSTNNSPKRVRWSEDLTQIRDISPRYKPNKWRFQSPNRRSKSPSECDHFTCTPGSSRKMVAASPVSLDRGDTYRSSSRTTSSSPSTRAAHLHCSPQLQKVVFRAVNNNNNNNISESSINNNNNNYWRPDRSNLSLTIRPSF